MTDNTFAEITPLPIRFPAAWAPTTPFNARLYPDAEVKIIETPSTPYIFQDSFDGINFNDCTLWDKNRILLAHATAAGRFRLPGSAYLRAPGCGLQLDHPGGELNHADRQLRTDPGAPGTAVLQ